MGKHQAAHRQRRDRSDKRKGRQTPSSDALPRGAVPRQEPPRSRLAGLLLIGAVVVGLAWGGVQLWMPSVDPPEVVLQRARQALQQGDYATAEQLASWIEPDDPLWPESRMIAGDAAVRMERFHAAAGYFDAVPRDGSEQAVRAARAMGEVLRVFGFLSDAEQQYRYVLEHRPDDVLTHERMAFVMGATGRRWESLPHLMFLVRTRNWDLENLILLGDPERMVDQREFLRHCEKNAPEEVLVQLGLATHELAERHELGQEGPGRSMLEQVVSKRPDLIAAQVHLGELLVDEDDEAFLRWHTALPPAAETHPDIWYIRGLWARRSGTATAAIRCFWEALARHPEHRRATFQMGEVLRLAGDPKAQLVQQQIDHLVDLPVVMKNILESQGADEAALRQAAQTMENLGRLWEARAWAGIAERLHPRSTWPIEMADRIEPLLQEGLARTITPKNLAQQLDFSGYEIPQSFLVGIPAPEKSRPASSEASIYFEEETTAGPAFTYYNAADVATPGTRMLEQTGGGVGVLDYDLDGWPDLFFPQGNEWPTGDEQATLTPEYRDGLFRNLHGRSFVDVASHAGIEGLEYGQGVAAGDYNKDGFPDLYVAAVGLNRLYRNNGDGTFTDVTEDSGIIGDSWTSSCVMVDVNGDTMPDLFDTNYLTGPEVYELICGGRGCSPLNFEGARDHLYLSQGDGTFRRVSEETLPFAGKGLGVVATVLEGDTRPSLFIANDQMPNFLLEFSPTDDEERIHVEERALLRGLALNAEGRSLAGMGVAADDSNGDGRLDLHVTNFRDEPNSLYSQDENGLFVDAARTAGLHAPGLPYVSWGTQFLDADLDGWVDLVVTNGHIDDYRDEGGLYHMPPQFFRNTGGGRFEDLSEANIGEFFHRKYPGRGLARLDWNRDGRMDFVISSINVPASLVTNRSTGVGRYLNVRLYGTVTPRDAVGSVVTVTTDGGEWTKQMTAGDGFMATNERMLQFGLGTIDRVRTVRVRWASGEETVLEDLPVDATVQIVEGAPRSILRDATGQVEMVEHSR